MVNLGQVTSGVAKYIDAEIVSKISGWQKWVFGALSGVAISKSTSIFQTLKENSFVKMLGVIDENDRIDLDLLYQQFKEQARKGTITFDVPMIGPMTLNETDVDKLYNYIGGTYG